MKTLNRDKIQRMFGQQAGGAGGSSVNDDGDGVSKLWVEQNYLSKEFFLRLFNIHGEDENDDPVDVQPNDLETTITDIEAMFGFWTEQYLSALGQNSEQGGGGITLNAALASINNSPLGNPTGTSTVLMFNGTTWVYATMGSTDMNTVWTALADGTDTHQINVSHLTTALSGYATTSQLSDYATVTDLEQLASYFNTLSGYFTNGAANEAVKLETARTIWGQQFDGTANITGDITQATCLEFSGIAGTATNGGFIDFHYAGGGADYTSRIIEDVSGVLKINNTIWAQLSGNVSIGTSTISQTYKLDVAGYTKTTRLYLADGVYLEYDSTNSGVHLVGAGFYSDSYVSALGVNSGGGGGGSDYIPLTGSDQIAGSLIPVTTNTFDLGDSTHAWRNIRGSSIYASNSITTYYLTANSTVTAVGSITSTAGNIITSAGYVSAAAGFKVPNLDNSYVLLADGTYSKLKTVNGYSLFGEGNIDASGGGTGNYLPLSGGTLTNSAYAAQLSIYRDSGANDAVITYMNVTDGVLGRIGFGGTNNNDDNIRVKPYVRIGEGYTSYPLIYTENLDTFGYKRLSSFNISGEGGAKLNIVNVGATIDYIHAYVSSNSASHANTRPLALQVGYGNIGVGTASPSYKLHVNGSLGISNGEIYIPFDTDASRGRGIFCKNTSDAITASIAYQNTNQQWIVNPIGAGEIYADAVGKYSLVVGNNLLTYNTYTILTSNNFSTYVPNTQVTQTAATSNHDSYRAVLLGNAFVSASYDGMANITTGTGTSIASGNLFAQPSTGNLITKGSITLYSSSSAATPALIFQRASLTEDADWDWKVYDEGGALGFFSNNRTDHAWVEALSIVPNQSGSGDAYLYGRQLIHGGNIANQSVNYAVTAGNAATATKLAADIVLWGNSFNGSTGIGYDSNHKASLNYVSSIAMDGTLSGVTEYNGGIKMSAGSGVSKIYLNTVGATTDYGHIYVSNADSSQTHRPLVLQNGYGNVGIGVIEPTQKLDVNGNVNINGTPTGCTSIDSLLYFDTTNSRIGVGVSAPDYGIDAIGGMRLRNSTSGTGSFNCGVFSDSNNPYIRMIDLNGSSVDIKIATVTSQGNTTYPLSIGDIYRQTRIIGQNVRIYSRLDASSTQQTPAIITTYGGRVIIGSDTTLHTNNADCRMSVSGSLCTAEDDGTFIKIGQIYIGYDSSNTALKVYKKDSNNNIIAANFYATGAVSAMGANTSGGGASNYIPLSGSTSITGDLTPSNSKYVNLGSSSKLWAGVYCTNLRAYGASSISGNLTMAGSITPTADQQYSLGTESLRFAGLFVHGRIYLSGMNIQYLSAGSGVLGGYHFQAGSSDIILETSGYVWQRTTSQYYSDIRRKNIVSYIDMPVDKIANAPIFTFTWKDFTGNMQQGSSAQYWRDVLPNGVAEASNGTLGMDYATTALISAVITARKVVDHEARIRLLEVENAALRNEINQLKKVA